MDDMIILNYDEVTINLSIQMQPSTSVILCHFFRYTDIQNIRIENTFLRNLKFICMCYMIVGWKSLYYSYINFK